MLIEFKIQLDDNGGVNVVPAQANGNPNLQGQQQLGVAYVTPGHSAPNPVAKKGGDAPLSDTGTGLPSSQGSGSGMVFVLGPIVICGSGPGHTGPGGDAPLSDTGTGAPNGNGQAVAKKNKDAAAKVAPKRRGK
jgi:hypothetical protein